MDAVNRKDRQPYGLHLPPVPIPCDTMNLAIDSEYTDERIKQVVTETESHLLAVTFALHAYRETHGDYPASLDALNKILPANLRTDPFAISGDLRYRLDGAKYALYSVGPDGRDDGGRPIYDSTRKGDTDTDQRARHSAKENSVGDVAAGVNR